MKELILNLVTSCENRISIVEELITGAFCTVTTLDAELVQVAGERNRLESRLQELLARNCSLRKKDFDMLMRPAISRYQRDSKALEKERRRANEGLRNYLDELKQSVCRLRQQLVDFVSEKEEAAALEATMGRIEAAYRQGGHQAFISLRDFQIRLGSFRKELEEMNIQLQRLVELGEAVKAEDLRQLPAGVAISTQGSDLESRKEDLEEPCPIPRADPAMALAVDAS